MATHCSTCNCDNPSALDTFNRRCERLVLARPLAIDKKRLPYVLDDAKYCFGFRPFVPSASSMKLVGLFLAGAAAGPSPDVSNAEAQSWERNNYDIAKANWLAARRWFAVVIPEPGGRPRPFEYHIGDSFDISLTSFSLLDLKAIKA